MYAMYFLNGQYARRAKPQHVKLPADRFTQANCPVLTTSAVEPAWLFDARDDAS